MENLTFEEFEQIIFAYMKTKYKIEHASAIYAGFSQEAKNMTEKSIRTVLDTYSDILNKKNMNNILEVQSTPDSFLLSQEEFEHMVFAFIEIQYKTKNPSAFYTRFSQEAKNMIQKSIHVVLDTYSDILNKKNNENISEVEIEKSSLTR